MRTCATPYPLSTMASSTPASFAAATMGIAGEYDSLERLGHSMDLRGVYTDPRALVLADAVAVVPRGPLVLIWCPFRSAVDQLDQEW